MSALSKSILLFVLNLLDAQLTLVWLHNDLATEANGLMAHVLQYGYTPFLLTKLAIGGFAAYTLYHWSHLRLARGGMTLVLGIYFVLMFVHAATGLSALGWHAPETLVAYVSHINP
jgi:hypothetical protein